MHLKMIGKHPIHKWPPLNLATIKVLHGKAEVVTRMVYSYVFDLGDESFLDDQLKILRDIERTRSR